MWIYIHCPRYLNVLYGYESNGISPRVGEYIGANVGGVECQFVVQEVLHRVRGDLNKTDDEDDHGKLSYIDILVEEISDGRRGQTC